MRSESVWKGQLCDLIYADDLSILKMSYREEDGMAGNYISLTQSKSEQNGGGDRHGGDTSAERRRTWPNTWRMKIQFDEPATFGKG